MKKCKIIIRDEVNIKIEDLELTTRKQLSKKFKFLLPYARHMPAYKLGRWDGMVSFFQMGGSTFLNLLPDILPVLNDEGYEIELDDQRVDYGEIKLEKITEEYWGDTVWPSGHKHEGEPIRLRDDQVEAVNHFIDNLQSLQEISTGAGKTITTATLSRVVEPYGRSIIVVPSKSLVVQTEEDYINCGLDVGVYFGDRKEIGKTHTICTWQSLNNMMKNTKDGEAEITINDFIEDVICVMIDEVHQAKADALKSLLTGPMSNIPIRWGLTGTVPKEDHEFISIKVSLGDVVNQVTAKSLQDKGILAQCHVNIQQLMDTKTFSNYQEELKFLVSDDTRIEFIAQQLNQIKQSGNTLILVDRISAGEKLNELIPGSVFVKGAVKLTERKEAYDEINQGTNHVVIATYGVAAVGINIPRIFNLVLIEPGKSFVRVIQSIGRGVRKAKDKDSVQIWDFTSTCKYAKRHLTQRKKFYKEAQYPYTITKIDYQKP